MLRSVVMKNGLFDHDHLVLKYSIAIGQITDS